jgi:hypothetical protein
VVAVPLKRVAAAAAARVNFLNIFKLLRAADDASRPPARIVYAAVPLSAR